MSDDSLPALWTADQPASRMMVTAAVNAALLEDRNRRDKERWVRIAGVLALSVLCPVLLWCAAYGKTPLVRAGYALIAAGTAMMVFAEWMYLAWSREGRPGSANALSQLQQTSFLLSRQATLIRTAPLWCAPVFIGTSFIGAWLYQEISFAAGCVLWATIAVTWLASALLGRSKGAELDGRSARMGQLLADLRWHRD